MKITQEEVSHIAHLARLKLNNDEIQLLQKQLSNILKYMEKLNQINTSNIQPTSHVIDINNVYRKDTRVDSLDINAALSNAPDRSKNFFRVPKIIE